MVNTLDLYFADFQPALKNRPHFSRDYGQPPSHRRKTDNPTLYDGTLKSIPFGRMGLPEEVANVALFLASPYASWVTGQTIAVAGGQGL